MRLVYPEHYRVSGFIRRIGILKPQLDELWAFETPTAKDLQDHNHRISVYQWNPRRKVGAYVYLGTAKWTSILHNIAEGHLEKISGI